MTIGTGETYLVVDIISEFIDYLSVAVVTGYILLGRDDWN
jgi:Ni2+-binding GTPase involved in maturation of urease and hydrogenase